MFGFKKKERKEENFKKIYGENYDIYLVVFRYVEVLNKELESIFSLITQTKTYDLDERRDEILKVNNLINQFNQDKTKLIAYLISNRNILSKKEEFNFLYVGNLNSLNYTFPTFSNMTSDKVYETAYHRFDMIFKTFLRMISKL